MAKVASVRKFGHVRELKEQVKQLDQPITCGLTLNLKVATGYRNGKKVVVPIGSGEDTPSNLEDLEFKEIEVPAEHFRGVVNKHRVQQLLSNHRKMFGDLGLPDDLDDREGLPWHTATEAYSPIDPRKVYLDMADAMEARGLAVYGEIRTYRQDGSIVIDVYLDEETIEVEGGTITVGFQTGTNHFGTSSLWSRALAVTNDEDTEFQALTDKDTFRHVGDANGKVKKYWRNTVSNIKNHTLALERNIQAAMNHIVDFTEKDYGLPLFYYYLGLKAAKYHEAAAATALVHSDYSYQIDAWTLYFSAAQTLTNEAQGSKDGQQVEQYYRSINRLLESPVSTENGIDQEFIEAEEEDCESHDNIPDDVDDAAASVREMQTTLLP